MPLAGTARRSRTSALMILVAMVASVMVAGDAGAAFPGANGKLAFVSDRNGTALDIYTMRLDGTGLANLTSSTFTAGHPSWSADGTKLAFFDYRNDHEEILTMNADGSGKRQLTNQQVGDFEPSWSPDGTRIAFFTFRHALNTTTNRNLEVYTMNPDGTDQIRLTNIPGADTSPAWSPDGSKIAFRSDRDGNSEIYVMNPDGTNPIRLTENLAEDLFPEWSPDGTRIAFTSNRDGNQEIYAMNADGTNPTNLTRSASEDYLAAWSPDGTKIAFTSERDGNREIYVMNADGSAPTNVTRNAASDYDPNWQPLAGTAPSTTTTSTVATTSTTSTSTTSTTAVPSTATEVVPSAGPRKAVFSARTTGVDPGRHYALFFADSARLANGPCHEVGTKVGGPAVAGSDGSLTSGGQVPVNAARGPGQVCFALKNNRANHSDAAAFSVF
jgi:Tol biopolymer transport system component